MYRNLGQGLLDEALAEAEGEVEAPLGRFGGLLIELGAGAYALRQHLAARRQAAQAKARRLDGRRLKNGPPR
jgi:hypothetical protein